MKINFQNITQKQRNAIKEVEGLFDIEMDMEGFPVLIQTSGCNIEIISTESQATICYGKEHQFIRAVGLLMENLKIKKVFRILEEPCYDSLGVMVDCSRNAVPHFNAFKKLVRHLAAMGYSSIQLYMEDIFELDEYPYFGYLRGRYTKNELKAMDQYADLFSIDLIPAIQTLAHLKQALKWKPMEEIKDVEDILLIDSENTYHFIETMLCTLSECFRSRRINIGMDEAGLVGLGRYLDQHGYVNRVDLMMKHLERVMALTRKYELKPMMWSDMLFRLVNGGEYYITQTEQKPDLQYTIPEDLTLIYWDYYSDKKESYDTMIQKHQNMSSHIMFAGGAWKWMGYSPNSHYSELIGQIAHQSCKENGIKEVLITLWGDNGSEASLFSILPSLTMWAELCYEDNSTQSHLATRFATCTKQCYEDFMMLDLLMLTPDNPSPGVHSVNPPKYIFYQDILLGLFDKHINETAYKDHFHTCTKTFDQMRTRNGEFNYIFETQYRMSKILEVKCRAGIEIRRAYKEQDRITLTQYAEHWLPQLINNIEEFVEVYNKQWLEENKVFGLEVIDLRIGGMLLRIRTAINRLTAYLNGTIAVMEELEEIILSFDGGNSKESIGVSCWHNMVTPSIISHI